MKGISNIISILILLIVAVSLLGMAWSTLWNYFNSKMTKVISAQDSSCSGASSAEILIKNEGTDEVNLVIMAAAEFRRISNTVPNSGFELGDSQPTFWGESGIETADVVLATDLSNSMSECMDTQEIRPDMDTLLLMHFDEANPVDAADSSGRGNHGRLGKYPGTDPSDPYFISDGGIPGLGGALSFDGSEDFVEIGNNALLKGFKNMTLESWINMRDFNQYMGVISKFYMEFEIAIYNNGTYIYFFRGNGSSYTSCGASYIFEKNKWYHVAAVLGGNYIEVYVNGVRIANCPGLALIPPSLESNNISIGRRPGSGGGSLYFNGLMDEVAIYNRSLTREEIKSHAKVLRGSSCPADGRPAMPPWCRYETALCPSASESQREEKYFQGTPSQSFSKINFVPAGGNVPDPSQCTWMDGCDSTQACITPFTAPIGERWVGSTQTQPGMCISPMCLNTYEYSGGAANITNQSCNSSYPFYKKYYINYSMCGWFNRSSCTSSLCGYAYQNLTNTLESLVIQSSSCLPSQCNAGLTCTGVSGEKYCTEGSCDTASGYSECPGCPNSCNPFDKFCCKTDKIMRKCLQQQDQCCWFYRECWQSRQNVCQAKQYQCCRPFQTCVQSPEFESVESCTPGINGAAPQTSSGCSDGWMCRTEGGSCYLCDFVAIRLAKKLDKGFVNSVFSYAEAGARVGLVSYGTNVTGSHEFVNKTEGRASLLSDISSYSYLTGQYGETCIACAIYNASELLQKSTADKKYMVIMSDGEANICLDGRKHGQSECNAVQDAISWAGKAGDAGIIIYTIGFGSQAGESTLIDIKNEGAPGSTYFDGRDPTQLENIYNDISQRIGNAGLDKNNKVYGEKSMILSAAKSPPVATSDPFPIDLRAGGQQEVSLYSRLSLTQGELQILVYFYDVFGKLMDSGRPVEAGKFTTSHSQFQWEFFPVNITPGAEKASIQFKFVDANPSGGASSQVWIDDVYFGPPVSCRKDGSIWQCGDLMIRKVSEDGEMYPFFDRSSVDPQKSVTLKDANCKGFCKYKIYTSNNVIDAYATCKYEGNA